jgi:ribosomal protein S27AE
MPNRRPRRIREAVLAFLADHRGRVFCAACIEAVMRTSAAEIALRQVEGLGARRHHGECSRCGRRRLVSGLADA